MSGFPLGRGGAIGGGAGIIGVLVVLATQCLGGGGGSVISGGNAFDAFNELEPEANLTPDAGADAGGELACGTTASGQDIVCAATTDVQDFWTTQFQEAGQEYQRTQTVFFRGQTNTGCGPATAQVGPFYCPADSLVYIDLDFLDALQNQLGAQGDFAKAYIIAHEYGHHVQNVLGISDQVRQAEQSDPSRANEYSIRLELQADCLAGNWARDGEDRGVFILSEQDIANAIDAAGAVGDDRIQAGAGGGVNPETWTHGSAADRQSWFQRGFQSGNPDDCNTFADDAPVESV
jgi:predicted metalloprotease